MLRTVHRARRQAEGLAVAALELDRLSCQQIAAETLELHPDGATVDLDEIASTPLVDCGCYGGCPQPRDAQLDDAYGLDDRFAGEPVERGDVADGGRRSIDGHADVSTGHGVIELHVEGVAGIGGHGIGDGRQLHDLDGTVVRLEAQPLGHRMAPRR